MGVTSGARTAFQLLNNKKKECLSIGHGDNVNRGITPERKSGQEEFEDTCTNEVIKIGLLKIILTKLEKNL
jgi:hypothetical protein